MNIFEGLYTPHLLSPQEQYESAARAAQGLGSALANGMHAGMQNNVNKAKQDLPPEPLPDAGFEQRPSNYDKFQRDTEMPPDYFAATSAGGLRNVTAGFE